MSRFNEINIGDSIMVNKAFTQEEVLYYLHHLSLDTNKIHYDYEFSKSTIFKDCIVPGLLTTSLFGGLLGSKLPGLGTIHLGQACRFAKPVYINELITAKITVVSKRHDKNIINFETTITKANNEIAITGEAIVMIKE